MELEGVKVNKETLHEMRDEIKIKMDLVAHNIYNQAGEEFNKEIVYSFSAE